MNRCMKCKSIFEASLAVPALAGNRCPVCASNDLISMAPNFDATVPGNTNHVVPMHREQYAELRVEAVLLASELGVDYYYAPKYHEYLAVLPNGAVASGSRDVKRGPVAVARSIFVRLATTATD